MPQKKKNTRAAKVVTKPLPDANSGYSVNSYVFLLLAVTVTLICFLNAFKNDFTNWDDVQYVIDNNLVKSLSWDNIKTIFTTRSVMGNYHPLAILSLAVDYHFHQLLPHGYHATSIFIHLCSVAMLFWFIRVLTGHDIVAFITALLFGIHPMHVESVAWVAERKDVLYVFFYFAALTAYMYYTRSTQRKIAFYSITFLLFAFSVLSKAQAVTLPVVLLLVDYFKGRKFEKWVWLEKIPFFLFSVLMGWLAIVAQKESGAIKDVPNNPLFDRILFASYSLFEYIWKLIVPAGYSAYYPYPDKPYPVIYYVAPFIAIALVALAARFYKNKTVVLGAAFYIVNIFLLLQLLPVGGAMMADRYSYLCSEGLFFMAAMGFNYLISNERFAAYKFPLIALGIIYAGYAGHQAYARNKVWKNSKFLFEDVIRQYKRVPIAYNNLGSYFQKHNQLDSALNNFNEAIRLKSSFPEARTNRSDVFRVQGKYALAIADCDTAIAADKNYVEAHMNRGIAYCFVGKYDDALKDFSFVISKKPNDASVYCNRGNLYDMKGKTDSAFSDYNEAIRLDPGYADAYFSRGRTYVKMKKYKLAIADLNHALELNTSTPDVYLFRSQAYKELGDYTNALNDAVTANNKGIQVNPAYLDQLKELAATKK